MTRSTPATGRIAASHRDDFGLAGRHVVVTGGSRGLGRGIAEAIAAAGGTVSIVARTAEQAEAAAASIVASGGSAHAVPADVADLAGLDALAAAIAETAPIDGVVHAAGVQLRKPAVDVEPEEFVRLQTINLHAPYFLSTAIARRQIAEGRPGSHVFIGSLSSTIGLPNLSPYVVAKTGLVGMARAFSAEWARHGIRSNTVGPGYFATEMTEGLLADPAALSRIEGRIPMGALGEPGDVGNACVFLLADASRYVSGVLLNVDGGWLAA